MRSAIEKPMLIESIRDKAVLIIVLMNNSNNIIMKIQPIRLYQEDPSPNTQNNLMRKIVCKISIQIRMLVKFSSDLGCPTLIRPSGGVVSL